MVFEDIKKEKIDEMSYNEYTLYSLWNTERMFSLFNKSFFRLETINILFRMKNYLWNFLYNNVRDLSIENKLEKITTIAETEELLKENISIGKEYYFGAIKNAVDKGDSASFFENYQELHEEAENQIKRLKNQTVLEFLEETESADFVQDFEKFRTKIQEAKYAPVHEDLYEFYNDIVKFYTKIME